MAAVPEDVVPFFAFADRRDLVKDLHEQPATELDVAVDAYLADLDAAGPARLEKLAAKEEDEKDEKELGKDKEEDKEGKEGKEDKEGDKEDKEGDKDQKDDIEKDQKDDKDGADQKFEEDRYPKVGDSGIFDVGPAERAPVSVGASPAGPRPGRQRPVM